MKRLAKRLGLFVLVFVLCLSGLTLLWSTLSPGLAKLAVETAGPLFRAIEAGNPTHVVASGSEIWVYRAVSDSEVAPFTWFDRFTFYALVPLIALFVATPGLALGKRAVRLVAGCAVLFAVQVLLLVLQVELAYAAVGLSSVWLLGVWQVLVRVAWEAAPIVVWVGFTASAWKRWLLSEWRSRSCSESRSAPAILRVESEGI